nr:hypothetical protein [Rhizobium leguminosarum]
MANASFSTRSENPWAFVRLFAKGHAAEADTADFKPCLAKSCGLHGLSSELLIGGAGNAPRGIMRR